MSLERWQKYSKASPCPICGGFNSGRKASGTLCKGFLHADRIHAFCQRNESPTLTNIYGLILYKHELSKFRPDTKSVQHSLDNYAKEEEGKRSGSFEGHDGQVPSSDIIIIEEGNTRIVQKEVTYEGIKLYKQELPPITAKWYVVEREGREVTRDLSLDTAKLFL